LRDHHKTEPKTNIAVRTLLAAGYTILGTHRQPRHIEIRCERKDILGATIPYLIAITDVDELTNDEIEDVKRSADAQSSVLVIVSAISSDDSVSWEDFTEALGGAVPSWQALSPEYEGALTLSATNELPEGESGEAWLIFEDLVGYGLEYIFGRRVRRLGGRKRGRTVSDMQAQTPQERVEVVDAKAAGGGGFDVTWSALRPLVEYVQRQKVRQQGHLFVSGAIVVSSKFQQDRSRLQQLSNQFLGATQAPVSFMTAEVLGRIVAILRDHPDLRNAIRWDSILTGGLIRLEAFTNELAAAESERIS
jgi:hypothetical protein